jgi:hypothetical protein
MRQAHPLTTNQAFLEILQREGNSPLGKVVQESWLRRCADSLDMPPGMLASMTIKDFMNWRYLKVLRQKADPSMLQGGVCRRMRLFQGRAIRKQLGYFAVLLSQGKTLFLAPEGNLTPDGKLCPLRGSLYRLVNMCGRTIRILPMNICYDFMTTDRMGIFLNIGQEIHDTKGLSKAELEQLVQDALLPLVVVTMSQIGSHSLYQEATFGNDTIIEESWQSQLAEQVRHAKKTGLNVDRALLEEQSFQRSFKNFVRYCLRKGQITTLSPGKFKINREAILDISSPGYSRNPVYYCHNELSTVLSAGV